MEVELVNGRGVVLVDNEDADLVSGRRWYLHSSGYACGPHGTPLMHRHITQAPRGVLVDHRNGDKLDNRRENLRVADHSLNAFNRQTVDRRSQSGVPGVTQTGRWWRAFIFKDGERLSLGKHHSLQGAAEIRAAAEIQYYGEITTATANALASMREG